MASLYRCRSNFGRHDWRLVHCRPFTQSASRAHLHDCRSPEPRRNAELRRRLYIAAAAILVGMIGGWFIADLLLNLLREPIYTIAEAQNRVATLNYDGISISLPQQFWSA